MKIIIFILLLSMLSSCFPIGDPAVTSFGIIFINNSTDTVNVRIYGHKWFDNDSIVVNMLGNGEPSYPSDSIEFYWVGDYDEMGDTWDTFFGYENIDALYVKVTKEMEFVYENKKYIVPSEDNCIKFYKYSLTDIVKLDKPKITITYP